MKQSQIFLKGEGAAWLRRNENKLGQKDDPVLLAMEKYQLKPRCVLEIGCSNGWRLDILHRVWRCRVEGVDPYAAPGIETLVQVWQGTADNLIYSETNSFDTVIYGWCLYLCDPEDYFRVAMEGDRVLKDDGFLIIYDFFSDYPYKNKYKHKSGLFSHKMDFAKLWLSHPGYYLYGREIIGDGDDQKAVTILQKKMKTAFQVGS